MFFDFFDCINNWSNPVFMNLITMDIYWPNNNNIKAETKTIKLKQLMNQCFFLLKLHTQTYTLTLKWSGSFFNTKKAEGRPFWPPPRSKIIISQKQKISPLTYPEKKTKKCKNFLIWLYMYVVYVVWLFTLKKTSNQKMPGKKSLYFSQGC